MDLSNFKGSAALRDSLTKRPLVMLVARNSSQGSKARSLAVDELYKAAEGLTVQLGIDFSALLPTPEQLHARIKSAPLTKSPTADGQTITHKIVTIDDAAEAGLVIVIGTGTGSKTDDAGAQPFVARLVEEIRIHKPALIFANRFDRFLRSAGAAMLLHEVTANHHVAMGDAQDGIHPGGDFAQVMSFFKAFSAEREAKGIPVKTRQAMKVHSGRKMVNGKVAFAAQTSPPPGLARIRMKSDTGGVGSAYLFIDSPWAYPDEVDTSGGLPKVCMNGKPVDQAALVCWALETLGKPGHTKASVGRALAKKGFSTDKYRVVHGAAASYPADAPKRASVLPLRSILENLEFYKTGVLEVRPGGHDSHNFTVTGCFPKRGYWAKPADFARIEKYLANLPVKGGRTLMSFVGVPVKANADEGFLRVNGKAEDSYAVRYPNRKGKTQVYNIPHSVLADIVADGLGEMAESVFIPLTPEDSPEVALLRDQNEEARRKATKLDSRCEAMKKQLLETDDDGEPILPASVRKQLGLELEELLSQAGAAHTEAAALGRKLRRLESEVGGSGAPVNRLLVLVESLRDPRRVEFNDEWKQALSFQFVSRRTKVKDVPDVWVEITGTLRLTHDNQTFLVPLHGVYQPSTRSNPKAAAEVFKQAMLQGVPYWDVDAGRKQELLPYVARAFGVDPRRFAIANCPDSRVTRVGATILANPEWGTAQVAAQLGEPEALVVAVRQRVTSSSRLSTWLSRRSECAAVFARLAHNYDGVVPASAVAKFITDPASAWLKLRARPFGAAWVRSGVKEYELLACPVCGSRKRCESRLVGVTGCICMACHTDVAGVVWDPGVHQWDML